MPGWCGDEYTAAPANWAPASRPVRPPGAVSAGWKRRVVPKEGAQDGDSLICSHGRGPGTARRSGSSPGRTGGSCRCTATGCSGSFADAEDAVQETMLAAWQEGIGGFTEERASLRTWLYKLATNRCLNARRAASRRPAREWDVSRVTNRPCRPRATSPSGCSRFLTPSSRAAVDRAARAGGPLRADRSHLAGLRHRPCPLLPPRQVAVLILRDVLGFHASEVAGMLEVSASTRPTAPSSEPAPACSAGSSRPPGHADRRPPQARPPRTRSWPSSPARGSRPTSTRWWPC